MVLCPCRNIFGFDLLTTCADLLLQLVQAVVRSVGDAFFDQRPNSLRGIQLRRVSRDAQQRDSLRDGYASGAMRWCTIPDEQQALAFGCVLSCESIEKQLHTIGIQSR